MAKRKTTIYVDEDLLTAVKVAAARSGKREYEVVEDALRRHLGLQEVLERIWAHTAADAVDSEEALGLAYRELRAARAERSTSKAS